MKDKFFKSTGVYAAKNGQNKTTFLCKHTKLVLKGKTRAPSVYAYNASKRNSCSGKVIIRNKSQSEYIAYIYPCSIDHNYVQKSERIKSNIKEYIIDCIGKSISSFKIRQMVLQNFNTKLLAHDIYNIFQRTKKLRNYRNSSDDATSTKMLIINLINANKIKVFHNCQEILIYSSDEQITIAEKFKGIIFDFA